MRDPVYLVLREIVTGDDYHSLSAYPSLADARGMAEAYSRDDPGVTYVIAIVTQAVTAEIATRWDE